MVPQIKPRVCVLRTDGTNCDSETRFAFDLAGAQSELVHVNQLRDGEKKLSHFQILVIPGGFSYGDDIHSGKVLAVELISFFRDALLEFVGAGKLVLGICNGFQVLVRTGLLPQQQFGSISTTLMSNNSGRFECRWVKVRVESSNSIFTKNLENSLMVMQAAHAEGKFYSTPNILENLEKNNQIVFRYVDIKGVPTSSYPDNPNGSLNAIAGICDPTGRIMGLMPHPERYVLKTQYPNWRRNSNCQPQGLAIFRNAVNFAVNEL